MHPKSGLSESRDELTIRLPLLSFTVPASGLSPEAREGIRQAVTAVYSFVAESALALSEKLECLTTLVREVTRHRAHAVYDLNPITARVLNRWGLGQLQKFVEPLSVPGTGMIQPLSLIQVATTPQLIPEIQRSQREVTIGGQEAKLETLAVVFGSSFSCVVEWRANELPSIDSNVTQQVNAILSSFAAKTPRERVATMGDLFTFIRNIPGTHAVQSPVRGREEISRENLREAISFTASLFPDRYDQAEIQHIFVSAVRHRQQLDGERFPDLAGMRLEEQFLYRDENGEPIAVSGLQVNSSDPSRGEITWFGIAPNAQGKGVGSEILNFTEADAKREGIRELEVIADTTSTDTTRFYKKLGFVFEGLVRFGRSILPRLKKDI